MAVYYNLKGTTQSEFQIGKGGPTLTNASGSLAIGTAGATTTLSAPDNADLILVAGPATTGNPGGDLILRAGDGTAGTGDGAITIDRGKLVTKAPTTTYAGFNLPPGTSPSSPVNGDLWLTSSHALNFRVNGVTIDLLSPEQVTVNANTSTDPSIYPLLVPSSATGPQSALIDNANFWYDASANILTATGGFEGNVYTITADGYIIFDEHTTAPGTPAAGTVAVYAKADGKIYRKDDTGTETELGGGAGSIAFNDLTDVDLTGAANNDLLYRSGGAWIDTAGQLTWDGSTLLATAGTISGASVVALSNTLEVQGSFPFLQLNQTDGGTNEKKWVWIYDNTALEMRAVNDASSAYSQAFVMSRSGYAISSLTFGNATDNPTFTFSGTGLTTLGGALTVNGVILGPGGSAGAPTYSFASDSNTGMFGNTAGEVYIVSDGTARLTVNSSGITVNGSASASSFTATGNAIEIQGTFPYLQLNQTDGGTDEKKWVWITDGTAMELRAMNDASSAYTNAFTFYRSAQSISNMTFGNVTSNPAYNFVGTGTTTFGGRIAAPAGTAAAPSIYFGDTGTGFYRATTADTISVAINGSQRVLFDTSGITMGSGKFFGPGGSAAAPTYSFVSDNNSGMYSNNSGTVYLVSDGTARLSVDNTGVDAVGTLTVNSNAVLFSKKTNGTATNQWVRIAKREANGGRATSIIRVYTTGGSQTPQHLEIFWDTTWQAVTTSLDINNNGLSYVTSVKSTANGITATYLEIYVTGTSISLNVEIEDVGYNNNVTTAAFETSFTAYTDDVVITDSHLKEFTRNNGATSISSTGSFTPQSHIQLSTNHLRFNTETFSYDGDTLPHYGLSWYSDSATTGTTAALTGYYGVRIFTSGVGQALFDSAGNLNFTNSGRVIAGASSTSGSVMMQGTYNNGATAVLGTEYSTGAPTISYASRPSTAASDTFVSAIGGSSLGRSAIVTGPGTIIFKTGSAQTVADGTAVTLVNPLILGTSSITIGSSTEILAQNNWLTYGYGGYINANDYYNTSQYASLRLIHFGSVSNGSTNVPEGPDNANAMLVMNKHTGGYCSQLYFPNNNNIWHRYQSAGSWGSWRKIQTLDSSGNHDEPLTIYRTGTSELSLRIYNNQAGAVANTSIHLGYPTEGYGWRITSNNNPSSTYAGNLQFTRGVGTSTYTVAGYFDNSSNLFLNASAVIGTGYRYYMDGGSSIGMGYNGVSSYSPVQLYGSKNSYGGFYDNYSGVNMMWDSGGNGGEYREVNSTWRTYWNTSNSSMGLGASTTSASYKLYVTGAIYATGDVVAFSDERKKENIVTVDNALEKINKLRGVYYNKIGEEKRSVGVIAQEVEKILPEVVTHSMVSDDSGEEHDEYGVDYGKMVGLLIEAVKELSAEVKMLKETR